MSAGDYFLKLQTLCAWYYVVEATEKMKVFCIYPFVSSSCAFLCQVDRVFMMDRVPHVSAGLSTSDNAGDTSSTVLMRDIFSSAGENVALE